MEQRWRRQEQKPHRLGGGSGSAVAPLLDVVDENNLEEPMDAAHDADVDVVVANLVVADNSENRPDDCRVYPWCRSFLLLSLVFFATEQRCDVSM